MDPSVQERLLASIESGRLVLLCGAGLSMSPPSSLPSAREIAITCFDRYAASVNPSCDPALREDLEGLARYFVSLGSLQTVFVERLVPWESFMRPPNPGHAAIADFLITRAAASALSANFDFLIERRAWDYWEDFYASLDGDEAMVRTNSHSPLLKFHGCAHRDRGATLWTKAQLADPIIMERIAKSRVWMAANLREKDLLVIGFWSDWAYFNDIIGEALREVRPLSITIADPAPAEVLETKAPQLWALAHQPHVTFTHVPCSGSELLDALRRAFSRGYLRKLLHAGRPAFENEIKAPCDPAWLEVPNLDSEDLYSLRRDAEGVPATMPARRKEPNGCEVLGLFHLLLRRAGATVIAGGYRVGDRTVRVVNGAGALLSTLRSRFTEPPATVTADIVACVGATDLGLPDHVVRSGRPGDIVRPAATGEWVDMARARELLSL